MSLENVPAAEIAGPGKALEEGDFSAMVLDFEPEFKTLRKKDVLIKLDWTNLKVFAGKGKARKEILCGVSGEANPSEVVAIMGPSGAGKTTLLNVLGGRNLSEVDLDGTFRVNGTVTDPRKFRSQVAYVIQDDALYHTATARESLEFSARLRLPRTTSDVDRKQLVDDMIDSLGLSKCQHTMIGNELVRGLSGGERKRVAIGVELVSNPGCLFLDEPTSGLDAFSAWKVLRILKAVASTGCTILCSIHQPSSEVFQEFTSLILMNSGHVTFQGALDDLAPVLRNVKLGIPPNTNPADHIIFLIQRGVDNLPVDDTNARRYGGKAPEGRAVNDVAIGQAQSFKDSFRAQRKERVSIVDQTYCLAKRELVGMMRDVDATVARFAGLIALSVITALIFMHAGDQNRASYTVQAHFGSMFLIWLIVMILVLEPALLVFPTERVIFIRECATKTYTSASYVLAKMLIEIPLTFVASLITLLITYWAVGLGGNFGTLLVTLWAVALQAISSAYVLGTIAANAKAAIEMESPIIVAQVLFLGIAIYLDQIPVWLRWIQYLVGTKYSLNLAMMIEFQPSRAVNQAIATDWETFLRRNEVIPTLTWFYIFMLFVFVFVLRFVAMWLLHEKIKRF